jgi:hypothetical protein
MASEVVESRLKVLEELSGHHLQVAQYMVQADDLSPTIVPLVKLEFNAVGAL